MQVRLSEITADLLSKVAKVWAVSSDGHKQPCVVWDSQRHLSSDGPQIEAALPQVAIVIVASLSSEDLEPLLAKLEEVDPMGAKRLIRD